MNAIFLSKVGLVLLLLFNKSFAQKTTRTANKLPNWKIINYTSDKDKSGLDILNFTIINNASEQIIINKVKLRLIHFFTNGIASIPSTEELTPIAYWDLDTPIDEGIYTYSVKYPARIQSKDAATVQIRMFREYGKEKAISLSKCGLFVFKIIFVDYKMNEVESREIELGYSAFVKKVRGKYVETYR